MVFGLPIQFKTYSTIQLFQRQVTTLQSKVLGTMLAYMAPAIKYNQDGLPLLDFD